MAEDIAIHTGTLTKRFWAKVDKTGDCWEWRGRNSRYGYGRISLRLRTVGKANRDLFAHRVAWELTYGPIPSGLCVLHRCDNRLCVRPDHLFLGTRTDNAADRQSKGRTRTGHLYGEKSTVAKLTAEQVRTIRRRYAEESISYKQLAREFQVDQSQIAHIVTRKQWGTVE